MPPLDTATFFLPGLIHQFGNLLLTVQGQVLHLEAERIPDMQRAVLGVVQRGSSSLQVVRALLGEETGAPGAAGELLAQLVELGRVPARERGVSLELRDAVGDGVGSCLVPAQAFVNGVGEAIRRWIEELPQGSTGTVAAWLEPAEGDAPGVRVQVVYDAGTGSLPFPLPCGEVADAMGPRMSLCLGTARMRPDGQGLELAFASSPVSLRSEA